ncbi:DUF3098 domain-containing protein [Sinomicrobium sp. M5D2P9]
MSKKDKDTTPQEFIFQKKNYTIMFAGLAFIAVGFILMTGGGGDDPNVFNPKIFSFRRIRLAPTLVIIGFALEVYAILVPAKKKEGPGK